MFQIKPKLLAAAVMLIFSSPAFSQIKEKPVIDTTITEEAKESSLDNIPVVSLDDNDGQDGSAQNISGQLNAGKNPFYDAANFHFGAVRFRIRGYDADLTSTFMNGAPMENLDNGFTPYGLWGGLNDVLRSRESSLGMQSLKYGFGNLGGATNMDTRAFRQYKQTKISYSLSNRNYVHRIMLTHSTGMMKNGWAFSFSGSRRWADQGFTDGTYYDGWSFFTAIDKRINARHLLSFVAFATPTENGRQGASTKEMTEIAGTNFYNPYWGYQNGKKRNASVAKTLQPMGILTHDWKVTPKTSLLTAASYMFGNRSTTGLDWYNAPDPRPDYYRYLPSYQDEAVYAQQILDAMKNNVNLRQINWDALYNANYTNTQTIHDVNGITDNNVTGKRSIYIVEERVIHTNKFNLNTTMNTSINSHIDFTAGLTYENQQNNYYKKVNDLLGGAFYVDKNQFAERDYGSNSSATQNDMNNPNRILGVGDKFGYNYNINIQKAAAWAQAVVKFSKLNFFFSAEHTYTQFYRTGYTRNGLYPDNSYGNSTRHNFYDYSVKTGASYKLKSGNYFFVNGAYITKAPFFENAYLSPRTRDFVQNNLRSENIASVEAGYVLNSPNLRFRATGYYTQFRNQMDVISAYSDVYRTFVNYALSNIGKTHAGIELGADVKLYKGLSLNAAAAIGRYYYDTRQNVVVTSDNNSIAFASNSPIIYSKNFRVATPQEAYTIGLNYRSPKYWFVNVNFNYFNQMWLGFDPLRRTYAAVDGVDPASKEWRKIIDQTQLDAQYTVDAFAGFSWLMNKRFKSLKKRTFMTFSLGVNNLLNNTKIVSGGFEQMRFDYQHLNLDKFPPKLFYAYGLNYSANIGLRF
ncbi:MAG: TonB-dependent receptor [Sphingobacteriales bacterium]|nr:TonB-dependent receptor [Sphingobacteriales bacterium]